MGIISQKLRNSAKGEACTFRIPGICQDDPETTVLCHIRDSAKGMGNKAHDFSAAFGCRACHYALDMHMLTQHDELYYSLRGLQRTWERWIERGLIVLPADPATAKRRPGRKAKIPGKPLAGTRASGFKRKMDGTTVRRTDDGR